MQDYQKRVIAEKGTLDERIGTYQQFIASCVFEEQPKAEQARLNHQLVHMANYSRVLGERIAAFKD
jgi:hypothetical protein